MLAQRVAQMAERKGIRVPHMEGGAHLGLAGTVCVKAAIPLIFQRGGGKDPDRDIRRATNDRLDAAGLIRQLNTSNVRAWIEVNSGNGWRFPTPEEEPEAFIRCARGDVAEKGVSMAFAAGTLTVRCVPKLEGLLVLGVSDRKPPHCARLLFAKFYEGRPMAFDKRGLFAIVGSQMRVWMHVGPQAVEREYAAERDFIIGANRYLEALIDHAKDSAPRAQYQIIDRTPLRLQTADSQAWPKAFTRPGTQLKIPTAQGVSRTFSVADVSDDGDVLILRGNAENVHLLERGELSMTADDKTLKRMREALVTISQGTHKAHSVLLTALTRPTALEELPPAKKVESAIQNERQREAIELALRTQDVCLIHGPPGTGKTTVICKIVEKLVRAGKRILLVAPTHVALDNVLERVGRRPGVVAIRLGSPDNVEQQAQGFLLENCRKHLTQNLAADLLKITADATPDNRVAAIQKGWAQHISKNEDAGSVLLMNANLVCATPIGIAMAPEFRDVEVVFDVMILDEASKATITDFLVPAARASQWILVGDHLQLPPYTDVDELEAVVSERVKRLDLPNGPEDWARDLSTQLRQHFDGRLHPDLTKRARDWRMLVEKVCEPFKLEREQLDALIALGADPQKWRAHRSGVAHDKALQLGAELLEIQRLVFPSVFEHLMHLPANRAVKLNCQHRMAPALAEFSSKLVYGGDYPSAPDTHKLGLDIPDLSSPSIWIDTALEPMNRRYERARDQKNWTGGDYSNALEIDVAMEVVETCAAWATQSWRGDPRKANSDAPFEVGIVCFYLKQALLLRDAIFRKLPAGKDPWRRHWHTHAANNAPIDVHVSIVDRFQGREKDLVILATTRSNPLGRRGHVDNLNRLNVAVTRARHKLIVIGDSTTLAGKHKGRPRPENDLLRQLYEMSEQKSKWGRSLGVNP